MNLLVRHDLADYVKRGHDTILQILAHAHVAIFLAGVLPGNDEDGLALAYQVVHQGITRRQVQDVVLHDPGRNDQHRLGRDLLRLRLVLDDFDQAIAINDLSGRNRNVLADLETLSTLQGLAT